MLENILSGTRIKYFTFTERKGIDPLKADILTYLDLTLLISGEMIYYFNGEKVVLHGGDALLFPVGSERMRQKTDTPVRYASINLYVHKDFRPFAQGHIKNCITATTIDILDIFLNEWNSMTKYAKEQQLILFAYLYNHLMESTEYTQNHHVSDIKKYIHNNLSNPILLEDIAERVHLAPEYCCNLFKQHTGKTIVAYITERRIEEAKQLFRDGCTSVGHVASQVGFNNASYFSKVFHKTTGLSPKEYYMSKQRKKRP